MLKQKWWPMTAFFLIVTVAVWTGRNLLAQRGVSAGVILAGNGLLFGITWLTNLMYARAMKTNKGHQFVRQVYAGFMLKFFLLIISAMLYFYFTDQINRPAVFVCMGLYLLYHLLGTVTVVKRPKQTGPESESESES